MRAAMAYGFQGQGQMHVGAMEVSTCRQRSSCVTPASISSSEMITPTPR
jgi:hypothetical protein